MIREELREYARKQPFQPFRVVLTTGDAYDIRHPDLIMVGQRSAVIGPTLKVLQDAASRGEALLCSRQPLKPATDN